MTRLATVHFRVFFFLNSATSKKNQSNKLKQLGVSYLEWRCFHVGGEQLLRTRHDLTLHLVPGGTGGPGGKQKQQVNTRGSVCVCVCMLGREGGGD